MNAIVKVALPVADICTQSMPNYYFEGVKLVIGFF
jgi:hypothetical protein